MNMLEKAVKYVEMNKSIKNNKYAPLYHFTPEIGWINDPNGFSRYRGKYHLFYQHNPYAPKWGPMHWGHATSSDLITFKHERIALAPIAEGENGGAAFSGTAIEVCGRHIVMYTEHWGNKQVQSIAVSDDGINYNRLPESPVITDMDLPRGFVFEHFRDPKIIYKNGNYIALIAVKDDNGNGNIVAFLSYDLVNWEYKGVALKHITGMGTMWECPDIVSIGDCDILTMSPQWMTDQGLKYANLHSSVYFIGKFDYETFKYNFVKYDEIDSGLDFYAPEMINDGNRVIMIAWMNMWERTLPTKELGHNWAGTMTLPREIVVKNNRLYFVPVIEIEKYRGQLHACNDVKCNKATLIKYKDVYELELSIRNIGLATIKLELFKTIAESVEIQYSKSTKELVFNRSNCGIKITGNKEYEKNSNLRKVDIGSVDELKLRIFVDKSTIEVFVNDGEYVLSSLVYPTSDESIVELTAVNGDFDYSCKYWDLVFE